ncbi:hypothetical protein [Tsuneonella deserti]|uniref:hypothetical protein n=1 Tax=Tsuneonella deserti TaxID=2035528 RepID=UPI00166A8D66|nr:hypothetical protein [Tsuneonella deserti]
MIATELAFARAAREKGTWTAFRDFATGDAQWPSPRWENVQTALKRVPDPAQPIVWEPDQVWISCDGSFALSSGPATHPGGKRSRFATIWQRQNGGEYRWVLDQGFDLEDGYSAPEMIPARVADCPAGSLGRTQRQPKARRAETWSSGRSNDGTLAWATELRADCSRTLVVSTLQDGVVEEVFRRSSATPPAPGNGAVTSC